MSSMNFACNVCGREVLSCTFVNGMKFTCDVCGREVFTCTFVNGMKFCAKCYQETFGETDKDRKIADLETKLAEKEKQLAEYGDINNALNSGLKDRCISCEEEHNQDKISFALEQLEKARKLIDELLDNCGDKQYKVWEVFDNQINELKGE